MDEKLIKKALSSLEVDTVKEDEFLVAQRVPESHKKMYDTVQRLTNKTFSKDLKKIVMMAIEMAHSKVAL